MKLLGEVHVGGDVAAFRACKYHVKRSARAILLDAQGRVCVQNLRKEGFHMLPGGGIDPGESIYDALKREVREEVGCDCEIIGELGMVLGSENAECEEQIFLVDYCFVARVVGEIGSPRLEADEAHSDTVSQWHDAEVVLAVIAGGRPNGYYVPMLRGQRTVERELVFLREFILNFRQNCLY